MAHNGIGLGEVAEPKSRIEVQMLNLAIQPHLHKTDVTCRFFFGWFVKIELLTSKKINYGF